MVHVMSEVKEDPRFQLEVVKWEGKLHCCYLNNFRIAGGKPWAGGETVKSWSVPLRELISAVPELRKLQSDFDAQRLRADTAEAGVQASVEVINSLHDQIAADEQRIAELLVMLRQAWVDDHVSAADCRKIDAALNPNPEAESHEKY
jgi:hypothetical protein